MTDPGSEPAVRDEILRFIARPVYPYLVTTTSGGAPYLRPVICVNDGFQIRMITRLASRKVQHVRHNSLVSIFWAGDDGTRQRSVMIQGRVSVLTDPDEIDAFAAAYRIKNPARTRPLPSGDDDLARAVLLVEPTLLRADGFTGFRPIVLRAADLVMPRAAAR
jgi:nitroimidazol reductase NimA-like FMN-containing flavoprotein (pyridoxamine 5'-phosphate oxidase superfamily)